MPTPPESGAGPVRPTPSSPLNKYTIAKALVAAGLFAWLIKSGRLDFSVLFSTPLSPFHGLGMLVLFVAMVLQA